MLLATGVTLGLNGFFGGGGSIPSDTFTRGLVGYWGFEEGGGFTAYDTSGNNNNGSVFGYVGYAGCVSGHTDNGNGTCSATYYPDADPETSSVDGQVVRWVPGSTWSSLHDSAGNDHYDATGAVEDLVYADSTPDQWIGIKRGIVLFNTSELPDSAIIQSAVLSLYGDSKIGLPSGWTFDTNIYSANPASNIDLVNADYGTLGTTTYSDTALSFESVLLGGYNDFSLNSAGLAAISKTGVSKFGVRNSNYDAANSAPPWSSLAICYVRFSQAEAGAGYKPKLVVTYKPQSTRSPKWAAGKVGGALSFDGVDDYVDCGTSTSFDIADAITLEAWVKITSAKMNDIIIDKRLPYKLQMSDANNVRMSLINLNLDTYYFAQTSDSPLTWGVWHYIVGTFNGSDKKIKIYVDGVLKNEADHPDSTLYVDSNQKVGVGGEWASEVGWRFFFNGSIDEVKIYNRALSAAEIRYHYNRGGPVGQWTFDEGNGKVAFDGSGNNNSGHIFGPALDFGGNDYVRVNNSASLTISGALTAEAWIKTSNNAEEYILFKGSGWEFGTSWEMQKTSSGNIMCARWYGDGSNANSKYASSTNTVTDGDWHHIVVLDDRTNLSIYIDGILRGSTGVSGLTPYTSESNPFTISNLGTRDTQYFTGIIDEVRIYSRALSAAEVLDHFRGKYTDNSGLVGYWTFDENTGQTAYDSSGNGNSGQLGSAPGADANDPTWVNYAPTWTTGKNGNALSFDGTNDFVDGGSDTNLDNISIITIEAWIKPNNGGGGDYGRIASKQNKEFFISSVKRLLFSHAFSGGAGGGQWYTPADSITFNTWQHVAITYNNTSAANDPVFYINGKSQSVTEQILPEGSASSDASYNLLIGNRLDNDRAFNGVIDDMRIYNYARTPDEIALDYNGGFAAHFGPSSSCDDDPGACMEQGLVGYWDFEESGGTTAYDKSNYNNNGTLTNGPRWTTGIKPLSGGAAGGGALQFDGKDDYMDCGNDSSLNPNKITVEAWVKPASYKNQKIVSKWDGTYDYILDLDSNIARFYVDTGANVALSTTNLSLNQWYHITGVYDGDNVIIYVNGYEESRDSFTGYVATGTDKVVIGSGSTLYNFFNGTIDDVRIYNRALSVSEVRYHYNRGGPVAYWKFDEGSGFTVYDSANNNNDGSAYGYAGCANGDTDNGDGTCTGTWQVGTSTDDNYIYWDGSQWVDWMEGPNFRAGYTTSAVYKQGGGARFTNVTIPQGAIIDQAYLTLRASESVSAATVNTVIIGEDTDDAATFSTVANYQARRGTVVGGANDNNITTASINWDAISAWTLNSDYNSPEIKTVIQEIVDRVGWASGNAMVLFWDDHAAGGTQSNYTYRSAYSYNGSTTYAPQLVVTYTPSFNPSWTTGKYGSALSFDGVDDYVNCGDGVSLDITSAITIEAWAHPTLLSATNQQLLSRDDGGSNRNYKLQINGGAHNLGFYMWIGDVSKGINSDNAITLNSWHHLVGSYDGVHLYLYVDGVSAATPVAVTGSIDNDDVSCLIGNRVTLDNPFSGLIDDVRIYNYARTAAEIRTDYNAGFAAHFGPVENSSPSACDRDPGACIEKGLVGYWGFEESGGQTVYDGSSYSNNGTLGSSASADASDPKWATGIKPLSGGAAGGGGLQFDGKDDYINAGNGTSLNVTNAVTMEAWVKLSTTTSVGGQNMIIEKGGWGTGNYSLHSSTYGAGPLRIGIFDLSPNNTDGTTNIVDGTWHHVVGTWDGSYYRIYVDGKLDMTPVSTTGTIAANTNPLTIGGRFGVTHISNGLIDEVRTYNRALSAEEIRYHYNRGGPVAYWKFDEGTGQTAFDESLNNNDGQLGSTTAADAGDPTWVAGKYGSALSFDGADDYVEVVNGTAYPSITLSAWVRQNDPTKATSQFIVWGWTDGQFGFFQESNNLRFDSARSGGSSIGYPLTSTDWHFYTLVHNAVTGERIAYVDGIEVGSDSLAINITENHPVFGRRGSLNQQYFNGLIDEVRIYNYARTQEQILQDYNAGLSAHFK